MAAAPAAAAVWADVLWGLGLGCLLGAGRDILGLVLGNGPVRCFCWDLLAFAAAAVLVCGFSAGVSASGLARFSSSTRSFVRAAMTSKIFIGKNPIVAVSKADAAVT